MQENVCENIFEAIKQADSTFDIKLLPYIESSRKYEAMTLANGKIGAIKTASLMQPWLFRGEKRYYKTVTPGLYRELDETKKLIAKLKIKDFEKVLMQIPEIALSVKQDVNVDFLALAQHYGLITNLIDLTSNVLVSAFFATNEGEEPYKVIEEGEGAIRLTSSFFFALNPKYHVEGIQPLKRPYFQDAIGYEVSENEDVTSMFQTIRFRHNKKCNEIIKRKFIDENNNSKLMPKEIIADIADRIKKSGNISKQSIIDYANENSLNYDEIVYKINDYINIVDYPIYEITSKEIEQYNKEQEENRNFITITSRLIYL